MRLLVAILAAYVVCGCAKPPANPTPAYVQAEQTETQAIHALEACGTSTTLADILARDDWEALTLDELKSCGGDLLALVKAAWDAHKAEQAALAVVSSVSQTDAGHD